MNHLHKLVFLLFLTLALSCGRYTANESQNLPGYQSAVATPSWYDPGAIDTLSVVTWNVEHFVDGYDNPYIDNGREENPPKDMSERRALLAEAIRKLDADIIVFQELESDSYLQAFAEEHVPEMGYEVFAALESPDWYMNVVMMSRVPMGVFYSYAHVSTPILGQTNDEGEPASQAFTNNRMWTADMLVNEHYSLTLTGLHLKAGGGERNQAWRLGQIALLRDHLGMLMRENAGRNMLVLGDLNTTPGSKEFNELLGDEPPLFIDPLAGTGAYSHPSDSLFWRIDHMLPNRQLQKELVPQSVEVIEPLSREQMIQISDHLPIIARFVTEEQE